MIKKITLAILTTVAGFTAWAQSTIINYDFNSGGSYAALAPTLASNINCSPSSTETFTTFAGIASSGAFTTNSTAGNAIAMSNSSGTNTRYFNFSITGSALVNYTTFKVYFQAQRSGTGAQTVTVQYSLNGGAFTAFATNTMSPGNGSFASTTLNLPVAVNNPSTSLDIRLLTSGASGTGTLRLDNFQVQAVLAAPITPTVAITGQDPNTPTAVNWALGSLKNQFYSASLSPAGGTATLTSVTANMSGTYLLADIPTSGLKLYYSTDATLVPAGDALLGSQSSAKSGATENITWSSLTQTIATGATGYIYATADIASGANVGSTLAGSFTSNANVVFTPTVNYNGSNSYSVTTDKTFAALPTNPSTFSVNCASEVKINIDMTAPAVGNVLVFANTTGSFTDPTGAGSSFTGANANYASATNYPAVGGKLVYSGSGASFAVSGLTAGQNYSFKAYSYSGSTWSSGTAVINGSSTTQPVSATVVSPTSGQLQLSWTNPSATSCYNNVIVIARQGSAVESSVSKASFDGLVSDADFTGANSVWTSNSNTNDVYDLTATLIGTDNTNFLVYKGTGTSVTLTGLTNGTPYYFRVFTVDGSGTAAKWSAAIDANGTPAQPGYYWNGGSIAALPANGGSGTWGTANAWRQPSASGSQATWANGNTAIFAGNAGAVTVDATRTATSYSFVTTSYTVQTTSSTQFGLAGPITLGTNNELVLAPNAGSTANGVIALESVNGTGTASVTIFGNQQGTAAAARINIAVANGSVNVPTNIVSATGTGVGGYVATATGAVVNGNITNNSSLTTCIGATSGFDITMNGVISGTSGLQFSAGASGGAGLVTLNNNNTYSGETRFNSALTGTIVMGANNVIPSGSDVIMSYSSGNGGMLDLNGFNQSIGNLSSNVVNASVIKNNSATSNSTLTINQTTAQTFGLGIKDGTSKNVAIVKKGAAALTLTSNGNSFSGGLTITNGELRFNPASPTLNLPSCPIALNGGVLGTSGISASSVLNLSTLNVTDNSTITLNASATHTINFAASSGVSWTAGKTVVITGWQGVYSTSTGSSGTAGKIFVGTGASDLTAGQLTQIKFFDGTTTYDATLLATGELVPYVFAITTKLRTTYCGYTAQSFGEFIAADSVLTATHYKFQLVNAATSYTQTFTNGSGYPYLALYLVPGISYNTTYTTTVAWSSDGVTFSPYGSACTLTSPATATTQLSVGSCGTSVADVNTLLFADQVSGATQYRFKIENTGLGYSQVITKNNSNFILSQFTGLANNTTYSVTVSVFIFGAWDVYGPLCTITTPLNLPLTKLSTGSCGATATSYSQLLFADAVSGATQYEYKLENTSLSYSQTFAKSNNNFILAQFANLANNTTYSVSVRSFVGGSWSNYGVACNVTTPGAPTTQLSASSCGSTPSSYNQLLFADAVTGATQYEYRLQNTALSYSQTFVKSNNNFILSQFTGLVNNTTYTVTVRPFINGAWSVFGSGCNVTTPGTPTTQLESGFCGITASSYSQLIKADLIGGATQYEYRLENTSLGYSQSFAKTNNNFILSQFTGLANSTAYSVQVRIYFNGAWGAYGPACTVTTPASAIILTQNVNTLASRIASANLNGQEETAFDAMAYPNPFNEQFNINLLSYKVNESVSIRVYDATGKLVEQHAVTPTMVNELNIGSDYTNGLYNIVITQGNKTKSIKVIRQ